MDQDERASYESQSQQLRAELKVWESKFAKTSNGKKPSRDDIKRNPDIARKYKDYHKIRDILSGKVVAPPRQAATRKSQQPTPRKRKSPADRQDDYPASVTPSKRTRAEATPSKGARTAGAAPSFITPSHPRFSSGPMSATPSTARKLFGTPAVPTSIGPTPQRDGRVLGLFDLMAPSPEACRVATPSKSTGKLGIMSRGSATTTPKRRTTTTLIAADDGGEDDDEDGRSGNRLGRTPVSSAKRHRLDSFMTTPLGNRRDANAAPRADLNKTPKSSTAAQDNLQFTTPEFLRRLPPKSIATGSAIARLDENGVPVADDSTADDLLDISSRRPFASRLPRKPLIRGLSSVVASLRKMEEEQLDEDLEALREVEAEMMGGGPPPPKPSVKSVSSQKPSLDNVIAAKSAAPREKEEVVEDSQLAAGGAEGPPPTGLLGGFDDEGMYDSPDDDKDAGLDRNGNPLRVFKKKGQKRTTRRVNMRPVRTRRPAAPVETPAEDSGDDDDVVPETQFAATSGSVPRDNRDEDGDDDVGLSGSDFEFDGGDENFEEGEDGRGGKSKASTKKGKGTGAKAAAGPGKGEKKKKKDEAGKEGKTERAPRKVSATAHQNFKRLKLRNNGSKGGPGFNSKFRRRR
ncbi:DNA replication regulator SLD2 [Magnaporthiopsis poae ATCC 64411]|uniref:DNA replication regulator SLD2 n=1 Tax=Magnaporthiopsis poae (strain ATCC 64411 / 73-15) TaxID=644358 RepID=A0A0C4DUV3_MAGP6|nr:DNA replication regulator SLD2 [Magnaporthiopsis poae ATCC 64411]